ncbi:MAG: CDP-glycerol glycerophosphotransferase family protein [Lachnospiraceae bacterium]|nr:CDP-glycerol glycerophosphotransferase family protein [Lachnospiraceae bacterium]
MFRIRTLFKMLCQHVIFPVVYFFNRLRPVDKKLIILADSHHDDCPEHMAYIRKQLLETDYKVEECYFNIYTIGAWEAFKRMVAFMARYATAGTVVICDYFLPVASCNKKKKTKVVQLWHGCGAFKKFGYNSTEDIPEGYVGNVHKNYNLVTVSGEGAIKPFETAMVLGVGNVIKPIGVSFTDRLYDENYIGLCKDKFRFEYPNANGKKVVLWAPTFRGNAKKKKGEEALLPGEAYVNLLMENEEYYVKKSLHPHLHKEGRMSTSELLCCADVLITDYSSVFFEYLLLDKPIIFFAPDFDGYSRSRGFYLDYKELPGVVLNLDTDLRPHVNKVLAQDDYSEQRALYRERYMAACDGCATKRIVDYIKEG